jgi:hypothetical protein
LELPGNQKSKIALFFTARAQSAQRAAPNRCGQKNKSWRYHSFLVEVRNEYLQ